MTLLPKPNVPLISGSGKAQIASKNYYDWFRTVEDLIGTSQSGTLPGAIRYDEAQALTQTQFQQARANIGLNSPPSIYDQYGGFVTPFDYGGSQYPLADATTAIQDAIASGRTVDLCNAFWTISDTITPKTGQLIRNGVIVKGFDGDAIDMSQSSCALERIWLACNGKNGRGIVISGGGSQTIISSMITDSVGYALEFIGNTSGNNFYSWDTAFQRTVSTLEGIKLPDGPEPTTSGARTFEHSRQGGYALIDLSGGFFTDIISGNNTLVTWTTDTNYVNIRFCRLAFGPVVKGTNTTLIANTIGHPATMDGSGHAYMMNVGSGITLNLGVTNTTVLTFANETLTDNSGSGTNKIL